MGENGGAETDMQQALRQFGDLFRQQLPGQLDRAQILLQGLGDKSDDAAALREVHRIFHKLAGSAATFGHAALGDLAREAEELLDPLLAAGHCQPAQLAPVGERLTRMAALAAAATGTGGPGA